MNFQKFLPKNAGFVIPHDIKNISDIKTKTNRNTGLLELPRDKNRVYKQDDFEQQWNLGLKLQIFVHWALFFLQLNLAMRLSTETEYHLCKV